MNVVRRPNAERRLVVLLLAAAGPSAGVAFRWNTEALTAVDSMTAQEF